MYNRCTNIIINFIPLSLDVIAPPKPAAGRPKIPKRSKVKAAAGKDQDQNPTHKSDEAENYEEMNTEIIYEVPA